MKYTCNPIVNQQCYYKSIIIFLSECKNILLRRTDHFSGIIFILIRLKIKTLAKI